MEVEPYTVSIPQAMLDDLDERLAHTRWPDEIPTAGWTKDALLTNVAIYWFTQTIHSSCRLYFETRHRPLHSDEGERVTVRCGIAHFPREAPAVDRAGAIAAGPVAPDPVYDPQRAAADQRAILRHVRASHRVVRLRAQRLLEVPPSRVEAAGTRLFAANWMMSRR